MFATVTETGTATDSQSSQLAASFIVTETATAADTIANVARFINLMIEQAAAGDQLTSNLGAVMLQQTKNVRRIASEARVRTIDAGDDPRTRIIGTEARGSVVAEDESPVYQ
jgi:hypothetical protein